MQNLEFENMLKSIKARLTRRWIRRPDCYHLAVETPIRG
jgi:hypothetical protein